MAGEAFNVRLYRLLRGGPMGRGTLLLTTRDRQTGEPHTVQIGCTRDGDDFLVTPRISADKEPSWYRNLQADPNVEVQSGGRRFHAQARVLSPEEAQKAGKSSPVVRLTAR